MKGESNAPGTLIQNLSDYCISPLQIMIDLPINKQRQETFDYQNNWVNFTGALAEIWLMHNWSGGYDTPYARSKLLTEVKPRSCGRPFADLLQVRAGGIGQHTGAVVACCMVLGKDSTAVLGHLDDQSIEDIVSGEEYEKLRRAHSNGRFEDVSYCKDCDQLLDVPDALVWSNIPDRSYGQSKISMNLDHRTFVPNKE